MEQNWKARFFRLASQRLNEKTERKVFDEKESKARWTKGARPDSVKTEQPRKALRQHVEIGHINK